MGGKDPLTPVADVEKIRDYLVLSSPVMRALILERIVSYLVNEKSTGAGG